jgi:hypothetical protein
MARMKVEQLSIFLENKTGRLAEVTRALKSAAINIRALSLADTTEFGIVRLIVDDQEKAKNVLKEQGFTVGRTHVVAVQVDDRPGGLDGILQLLSDTGINVEYMYSFVQAKGKNAIIILRFDKTDEALATLAAHNIPTISGDTLYHM